jgi:hypothetical protein
MPVWFPVAIGFMGLLAWLWITQSSIQNAFRERAVQGTAEVTSYSISRSGKHNIYRVRYKYYAPRAGGTPEEFTGSHAVNEAAYHTLERGGALEIVYLPDMPMQSRPAAHLLDPRYERNNSPAFIVIPLGIAGIFLLSLMPEVSATTPTRTPARVPSSEMIRDVGIIERAVSERLIGWRESATDKSVVVAGRDAGFGAGDREFSMVVYGECKEDQFYAFVLKNVLPGSGGAMTGTAYSYTPGSHPKQCKPQGWVILTDTDVTNGWYHVMVSIPGA